jgi:ubiquinone/menaquinone biosynthesis C-methylase UbiE
MSNSLITTFKELVEITFWRFKKFREGDLSNTHYKTFYTSYFSLEESFYENKRILDVGCGPRGSLEWAHMTKERIGIDPLVDTYLKIGAKKHQMKYVKAYSENIPFTNEYFDVVCSFNSLDHVENLEQSVLEMKRVLKKGGVFLLIVDIHNYPTPTEPQSLKWDFVTTYFSDFKILREDRLKNTKRGRIYSNARNKIPINNGDSKNGLLVTKLQKI